jgi:hypothetical protein
MTGTDAERTGEPGARAVLRSVVLADPAGHPLCVFAVSDETFATPGGA